jgi:hypothetical protein
MVGKLQRMTVRANSSAADPRRRRLFGPGIWRQEFEERLTSKAVHAVRKIGGVAIPGHLQDLCHRAND